MFISNCTCSSLDSLKLFICLLLTEACFIIAKKNIHKIHEKDVACNIWVM